MMADGAAKWRRSNTVNRYSYPTNMDAYHQRPEWNNPDGQSTTFWNGSRQSVDLRRTIYGYLR
jgi:hypothetical protein